MIILKWKCSVRLNDGCIQLIISFVCKSYLVKPSILTDRVVRFSSFLLYILQFWCKVKLVCKLLSTTVERVHIKSTACVKRLWTSTRLCFHIYTVQISAVSIHTILSCPQKKCSVKSSSTLWFFFVLKFLKLPNYFQVYIFIL